MANESIPVGFIWIVTGNHRKRGTAGLVLVGRANVGKSALLGRLTGRYMTVSNCPGTTVEIARGMLAVAAPAPRSSAPPTSTGRRQVASRVFQPSAWPRAVR